MDHQQDADWQIGGYIDDPEEVENAILGMKFLSYKDFFEKMINFT